MIFYKFPKNVDNLKMYFEKSNMNHKGLQSGTLYLNRFTFYSYIHFHIKCTINQTYHQIHKPSSLNKSLNY